MFKKTAIILFFLATLLLPIFVYSVDSTFGLDKTASTTGYDINGDQGNLNTMVGKVVNVGFGMVAFVFFGLTVYAGLRWLSARGNEEFITRAKRTMEQAIIGLILVALSYAITNFVMTKLQDQSSAGNTSGCCIYSDSCINVASSGDCISGGKYYANGSTECSQCP